MLLTILKKYKADGWLMSQVHPTLPLTIWNYTQKTQFERKWDEVTLQCRGLVTDDDTGEVVARPFRKFFNMEEARHTATEEFAAYEKMDGSLGISFIYKGENIFASRGSFTSEQCLKGIEMMNDSLNERMLNPADPEYTYMFEIIYPENRIVVDYGTDEKLVLLGAIHTETGEEMPYSHLVMDNAYAFEIVKRYDGLNFIIDLKHLITDEREGFVVLFSNGDRMKIKGDEYIRLHRIMTNVSTTSIWDFLKTDGDINELLDNVPDEFYNKIKEYKTSLEVDFIQLSTKLNNNFKYYLEERNGDPYIPSKREFSEWVNIQPRNYQSVYWRLIDKLNYSEIIWKILKPEFRKL